MVTTRSCIACNRADWVLAGARLISSASKNEVKMGPLMSENSLRCRLKTLVPVMSAGIRSGVNWMRAKSPPEHAGQRAHEQRFGHAGHAFDEGVVAGEDGDERLFDDVVLADDDLAGFRPRLGEDFLESFSIHNFGCELRVPRMEQIFL